MRERRRLAIEGVVQGIGFRPFVYRLAASEGLVGFVRNDGSGVTVEAEGNADALDRFCARLLKEIPTGGRIDRLHMEAIPVETSETAFCIAKSAHLERIASSLAPDRFVCADCIREMDDPSDRRYRYPFINCTHCGPRYTITERLPYDRPNTSMKVFPLCEACRAEYENPRDRRFHAEPVACPICGPHLHLEMETTSSGDAIENACTLLREGRIVSVKGIGGFHLAVNAEDRSAVVRLRQLKHRARKPFALMIKNVELAKNFVELSEEAEQLLTSPAAPIVLAPLRKGVPFAKWVAPGLSDLGVMLPYSPLHLLLLSKGPPILVMTSGNPPSEPISISNDEALQKLGADATLVHDRDIVVAADDSVLRTDPFGPIFIRRSRGYVPSPIDAPHLPERSVLGLGALLKVTVSTLHQGRLIVGRHLGDLDNEAAEEAFFEEVGRMLSFLGMSPEAVALDLHPDLASAALVRERFSHLPAIRVQHHHAHLAAVMVEHGLGPNDVTAGILLDGFGLGTDGLLWGGEVLVGGYREFTRFAHLRSIPQPGGDRAAIEPYRMAMSLLFDAELPHEGLPHADPRIAEIIRLSNVSPLTSSAGRLFDGISALLGIAHPSQDYEGEAACLLEAAADPTIGDAYPLPLENGVLDTRALTRALMSDTSAVAVRAARFINGLADGLVAAALSTGERRVALGGGCMVNRLLVRRLIEKLIDGGVEVLFPKLLPPGDGAISAGQVACAASKLD